MQDTWRLEREHHDGEDNGHYGTADPPDVEFVAEEIVGCGGYHGGLETVECGGGEGDDHDKHDTYGPCWELLEKVEEGNAAILIRVGWIESTGPGCD